MELIREESEKVKITSARDVYNYLEEYKNQDREMFIVLGLNTRNRILYKEVVTIGTLDSSLLHPREVFKMAFIKSASKIIIAHNHPSGDSNPSEEDLDITKRLINVGKELDIKILDHVIIGNKNYYSNTEGDKTTIGKTEEELKQEEKKVLIENFIEYAYKNKASQNKLNKIKEEYLEINKTGV